MTSRKPPSQIDPTYVAQRHSRSLQSMVPGTMQGRIANASPLPGRRLADPTSQEPAEVVFSYHGPLAISSSLPYLVTQTSKIIRVAVVFQTPGSSTSIFTVQQGTTDLVSITLAGGATQGVLNLAVPVPVDEGDVLRAHCSVAGAGANGVTLQIAFTL